MKTKLSSTHVDLEANAPRMLALGLLVVTVLLSLTGCKGQSGATTGVDPAGAYTLVSVDGKNVPCQIKHQGAAMTVKSGAFTINPDGTCRSQTTFSVPPHKDINREVKATWTRDGNKVTMKWEGAGTTTGKVSADTFTMNNEGMVFTYRK